MLMKKGFTLAELLVVLAIIGILVALALPNFTTTKEKTLDREARVTLALMRAAGRIYKMEFGTGAYYPVDDSTPTVALINTDLKLSLPTTASPNWSYSVTNSLTGTNQATRTVGSSTRTWKLDSAGSSEDPACTPVGSCYQ